MTEIDNFVIISWWGVACSQSKNWKIPEIKREEEELLSSF